MFSGFTDQKLIKEMKLDSSLSIVADAGHFYLDNEIHTSPS